MHELCPESNRGATAVSKPSWMFPLILTVLKGDCNREYYNPYSAP